MRTHVSHKAVTGTKAKKVYHPRAGRKKFTNKIERRLHYVLETLLLVVALNAFAGGYYGMAGAKDIPKEWLQGSPFSDYFIPGLFLFVVIGGSSLIAAVALFQRYPQGINTAIVAAALVLAWIAVQVSIIGYVSWMQPATAAAGLAILLFALLLKRM